MYEGYLRMLLEPLGVYDLTAGTINGAELYALGGGFDTVSDMLDTVERESLTATAENVGLVRREALFARRNAAVTPEDRRAAIAALLQIDGDSLTPTAINKTIRGCGIKARAEELGDGKLRVIFPEVAGIPEEFDKIRDVILDILPCHLNVEFYFRYLTWEECHRVGFTWQMVERAEHTWESFQTAIPPEE